MAQTLFDKIWDAHVVKQYDDGSTLIFIDRVFFHERTGGIALASLQADGRSVANPAHAFGIMDHIVDTRPTRTKPTLVPNGEQFIAATRNHSQACGIRLFDVDDPRQGISHVVSPEQGIALPGLTFVCPDSHTCTLGGLGALAWGIGSSDCEHALATETLRVKKPSQLRISIHGALNPGVTAKDIILYLISRHGADGAAGSMIEFAGTTIDTLSVEGRLTLCNMAVEFSGFSGIIAPDQKTLEYVKGRSFAPSEDLWDKALADWHQLRSDQNAEFDREIELDAASIKPMVTWGTSPAQAIAIGESIPLTDSFTEIKKPAVERALDYIGLSEGDAIKGIAIDTAFIGSCTNARLSDLKAAARVLKDQRIAAGVQAVCVPGSSAVKRQAEAEGIDQIFKDAGFEWRDSGCAMCFYAGGEAFPANARVISTTNRNFENRQGRGARTHLASPAMVASSAIAGVISDEYLIDDDRR